MMLLVSRVECLFVCLLVCLLVCLQAAAVETNAAYRAS